MNIAAIAAWSDLGCSEGYLTVNWMTQAYHALKAVPRDSVPDLLLPIYNDTTSIYVPSRLPTSHSDRDGLPLMIPSIESSRMAALFVACSQFAEPSSRNCGCDSKTGAVTFAECLAIPRVHICRSLGGSPALPYHGACAGCVYYSGAKIGGEICTRGIVGRAETANATREKIQDLQHGLEIVLDKHLKQRLEKSLDVEVTKLTRYVQELEAEIAQLVTDGVPVPDVMGTSLADNRRVVGL